MYPYSLLVPQYDYDIHCIDNNNNDDIDDSVDDDDYNGDDDDDDGNDDDEGDHLACLPLRLAV